MAVKFISVAYVILQVTKIETSWEKKKGNKGKGHTQKWVMYDLIS